MLEGVLLLAHGSRRKDANGAIEEILTKIQKQGNQQRIYEAALLQFATPTMEQGVDKLIAKGANRIIIAPLFLVPGSHIEKDIPDKVKELKKNYPQVEFLVTGYLGTDDRIAEIMLDRVEEAIK